MSHSFLQQTFPVRQGKFVNIVSLIHPSSIPKRLLNIFSTSYQVGFVRDPEHKKLGDRTGPWSEPRPAEEMLEDFSTFSDECVNMLRVSAESVRGAGRVDAGTPSH